MSSKTISERYEENQRLKRINQNVNEIVSELRRPCQELIDINARLDHTAFGDYFKNKYSWLHKETPKLFEMVLSLYPTNPQLFTKIYCDMFQSANCINTGTVSKEVAEPEIGQKLFDVYVKPKVKDMVAKDDDEPQVLVGGIPVDITEEFLRNKLKQNN
jgi:hypothetical protein